jgi:hypothetical protein
MQNYLIAAAENAHEEEAEGVHDKTAKGRLRIGQLFPGLRKHPERCGEAIIQSTLGAPCVHAGTPKAALFLLSLPIFAKG